MSSTVLWVLQNLVIGSPAQPILSRILMPKRLCLLLTACGAPDRLRCLVSRHFSALYCASLLWEPHEMLWWRKS